jgi:hypothetical protein
MTKTIDDLKLLQADLMARRRSDAYAINDAGDVEQIKKVVQVHLAIEAIDKVIKEIEGERKPEMGAMVT